MNFFAAFAVPFIVGALVMLFALLYKYVGWFSSLTPQQKMSIARGIPTRRTLCAIREVVEESLFHKSLFRVNPLLGYMHSAFALGWFLLILMGWIETISYIGFRHIPLQGHVFFKFFAAQHFVDHSFFFDFVMDLLLLYILSGLVLAWYKRIRSKALGLKHTTRHALLDKIALYDMWLIFPARLLSESVTAALFGGGGFMTGTLGYWMSGWIPRVVLGDIFTVSWWVYSISLGGFFVLLPWTRYMHIFTEIPLIFLRHYSLESGQKPSSFDNFQVEACSRCGVCIDPCQLRSSLGYSGVQSVYFLRQRRASKSRTETLDNCLMCGRCSGVCPVKLDLDMLRLNSREAASVGLGRKSFGYLPPVVAAQPDPKPVVAYFGGCMTRLTPRTESAMRQVFDAVGESVWYADDEGAVCCGRGLRLSGEVDAADRLVAHNTDLFRAKGVTTIVTPCPICVQSFKREYRLEGVEVVHHSEYIARMIESKRLSPQMSACRFVYHDPCELGRGQGVYAAPRRVIGSVGQLVEPRHTGADALCCGSSLANLTITDWQQKRIAADLAAELAAAGADVIVTGCPLCKHAISRATRREVMDISEILFIS